MPRHLSEANLVEALEGLGDAATRAHLVECGACAARVREMERTVRLASDAEVPEPSPLYWETFRQQVGRRIEEEPPRTRWSRFWVPGLAAAVVAGLAIVSFLPASHPPLATPAGPLPAWSALPEDDAAAMAVLRSLAPSEDDLEPFEGDEGVAERIAGLSDDESRRLAEALRGEWEGPRT
jgi:anti-sigma factor RsiW